MRFSEVGSIDNIHFPITSRVCVICSPSHKAEVGHQLGRNDVSYSVVLADDFHDTLDINADIIVLYKVSSAFSFIAKNRFSQDPCMVYHIPQLQINE